MFAYGFLSVVLVLYLAQLGLNQGLLGLLLSLTLIGDAAISLWMTPPADRIGRRRILIAGAGLMLFAGILFAVTDRVALLLIARPISLRSDGCAASRALHAIIAESRGRPFRRPANSYPSRITSLWPGCAEAVYVVRFGRFRRRLPFSNPPPLLVSRSPPPPTPTP